MKKVYTIVFALFIAAISHAANRFSVATGNWNATTTWSATSGGAPGASVPAAGDVVTIEGGFTVTLNVNSAALNTLTIVSGSTLSTTTTRTLTATTLNLNGSYVNGSTGTITVTTMTVGSTGIYAHAINGGTIPTATWNSSSTCNITGVVGTIPGGLTGQTFGNMTWNCASQTAATTPGAGLAIAGTLTVQNTNTGEFRFGDPGTNTVGNFVQSGGTVRIGSNTPRTVTVSGNVSISGGTLDMTTGNQIGTLNVGGNFSHTGGTITETGSASGAIIFNKTGVQVYTSGGTVTNTINYTVNSGSTLQMAANTTVLTGNSFTLSAGGTLEIRSTAGITSSGATGNIQTTTRTYSTTANYIYSGIAGSQVSGNGLPASVNSLTVNNSGGLSMTNAVTLNSATTPLTLTNGIISGALITISSAYTGAGGGGSASSYINGSLAKTGNTDYEFPVGNATLYRPISVSSLSGSATITASYAQGNPKTAFGTALAAGINHIGVCEYWLLDDGPATVTAKVGLKFGASCNSDPYVDNPATLLVAHWNGSQWDNLGTDGTATSFSVKSSTASAFSPFTIGSSSSLNPLPVKISGIKAYEKQQGVQIDWTAYSEENLSRYEVERSTNGLTFTAIGTVSALNSTAETRYGFFDANPQPGVNFYRLRNVDLDGKTGFSSIVKVNLDKNVKGFTLYPNPVINGYLSFQSANLVKGNYNVRVFNAGGQQVYSQRISHTGGAINQTIQLPAGTLPGMYTILVNGEEGNVMSKTFIVQ